MIIINYFSFSQVVAVVLDDADAATTLGVVITFTSFESVGNAA